MRFSTVAAALLAGLTQAYDLTLYSQVGWEGEEVGFDFSGRHDVGFAAQSWEFSSWSNDGCCVRFCSEGNPVGYRCGDDSNYRSSSPIDVVVTGCDEDLLDC